jgi:hypothetical protein
LRLNGYGAFAAGRSQAGCRQDALLNRQAPCQQPACVASSKVSRFVIADHPADRSGRERILLGVRSERRAVRRHQPDRKTKARRSCADGLSVRRRVSRHRLLANSKDGF